MKGKQITTLLTTVFVLFASTMLVEGQNAPTRSLKWKVAIGRFSNETQYGKGIFYDRENDPIAKQATDILSAKLVASVSLSFLSDPMPKHLLKRLKREHQQIV